MTSTGDSKRFLRPRSSNNM